MPPRVLISVRNQRLSHYNEDGELLGEYPVSTAEKGTGCREGSYTTPTGRFRIGEMIGHDAEPFTVFKGRKPVSLHDPKHETSDDLITSRIIWLDGLQEMNANTKERYIYIHGTNHESRIGTKCSLGCIRMLNSDIIKFFGELSPETHIAINL